MKNKTWLILIVLVLFTISCALDSQNTLKRAEEWAVTQTADAELYKSLTSGATPDRIHNPKRLPNLFPRVVPQRLLRLQTFRTIWLNTRYPPQITGVLAPSVGI